jgi:hypothetical protein
MADNGWDANGGRNMGFFFPPRSKSPVAVRLGNENRHIAGDQRGLDMKQYLLSVCYPAGGTPPPPERLERIMRDLRAIETDMKAQGVWVFSGGLTDSGSATVVREREGEVVMMDGPFIEAREQIGGVTIVKSPDLDGALAWARRLTQAIGVPIEVRAFIPGHC